MRTLSSRLQNVAIQSTDAFRYYSRRAAMSGEASLPLTLLKLRYSDANLQRY